MRTREIRFRISFFFLLPVRLSGACFRHAVDQLFSRRVDHNDIRKVNRE